VKNTQVNFLNFGYNVEFRFYFAFYLRRVLRVAESLRFCSEPN
jgi:hypothetical protein